MELVNPGIGGMAVLRLEDKYNRCERYEYEIWYVNRDTLVGGF